MAINENEDNDDADNTDDKYDSYNTYLELDTPEYAGRIQKEFVLEQLLAMGGIRLAAILNYLFAEESAVLNRS